jgi:cytochrome c-type biogenesis protein CcmH
MENLNHEFHELARILNGGFRETQARVDGAGLARSELDRPRSILLLFREIRVIRGKGFGAVATLLALVLAALATQSASAQAGTPPSAVTDNDVNRVAHQLYCPVCENIPLDVCPTQACFQWRETIRAKLAAGWTDQQILDYFVAQYGERVLAKPSTNGLNLLVWVIPPVLLLAGSLVLWRFLSTVRPPVAATAPAGGAGLDADEYTDRLEQELRKRL